MAIDTSVQQQRRTRIELLLERQLYTRSTEEQFFFGLAGLLYNRSVYSGKPYVRINGVSAQAAR